MFAVLTEYLVLAQPPLCCFSNCLQYACLQSTALIVAFEFCVPYTRQTFHRNKAKNNEFSRTVVQKTWSFGRLTLNSSNNEKCFSDIFGNRCVTKSGNSASTTEGQETFLPDDEVQRAQCNIQISFITTQPIRERVRK